MVHVGVAFQAEQLGDFHRADAAAAAQVVTQQIDDHQVLCAVLVAGQQFGGEGSILRRVGAAWPRAFDRAGFDLPGADPHEALGRKTQNRIGPRQAQVAGERRRASCSQRTIGGPWVTDALRLKALCKVDLVAVAGQNVGLNAFESMAIVIRADAGLKRLAETELRVRLRDIDREQLNQSFALAGGQRRVKNQLTGLLLMITDQRPGVEPQTGLGQLQVVNGLIRQRLQASTKLITQITDQAASEGQLASVRQLRCAERLEAVAQALEVGGAVFIIGNAQFLQRPCTEQVMSAPHGCRPAAVEQHRTRRFADSRKERDRVGAVGQGVYRTDRHRRISVLETRLAIVALPVRQS
ncbi:hypothetical protein ALQ37_05530 [Pseudomonas syringae pv. aptata]|uniref:Uncharacterized protein n=1 Tax=Pseudomonas syringae pv. aptata TaxID=83167 RepID=A0A3M3WEI9_PSEAP|nr:hypothetical protein ALQ37_05530 [Pseudomonas syringae pv. aptata]